MAAAARAFSASFCMLARPFDGERGGCGFEEFFKLRKACTCAVRLSSRLHDGVGSDQQDEVH